MEGVEGEERVVESSVAQPSPARRTPLSAEALRYGDTCTYFNILLSSSGI